MFLRVRYEQDRLCPKACWLPAVKRSRKKVTKEVEMEGADLSAVADGEIGAGAEGDDSDA